MNIQKIDSFRKDNYDTWKVLIEALIEKNDGMGYVDGTIPRPEVTEGAGDAQIAAAKAWNIADRKVRADIILATSPSEAEYLALGEATKEAITLQQFLTELEMSPSNSGTVIFNDNQGAQLLAQNSTYNSRTKHIDVRHHFIRECVQDDKINLKYMPAADMPADVFTKALPRNKQEDFTKQLGVGAVGKFEEKCREASPISLMQITL